MKVVVDTNVLVSGILKQHGSEASVLRLIADKTLSWCVSAAVIAEYRTVRTRPKFNFNPAIIDLWMDMAATGVVVSPSSIVTVSPDEADNRFLECAEAAKADFLVTGNKDLLEANVDDIAIISTGEFARNILSK